MKETNEMALAKHVMTVAMMLSILSLWMQMLDGPAYADEPANTADAAVYATPTDIVCNEDYVPDAALPPAETAAPEPAPPVPKVTPTRKPASRTRRAPALYDVPAATLAADPDFAALMQAAQKYIGYPYVWGGSKPSTGFDCSGFVCYVYTQAGLYDKGRRGATGLYKLCEQVSAEDARPGDLVFFKGTMGAEVKGITHVGIYVGDQMMLHCGKPVGYADLDDPQWVRHFYAYGRLPAAEQPIE